MSLFDDIKNYTTINEQEKHDQAQMLQFIKHNPDCLDRENQIAHFTASIWTVNKERTKTLMVYHNIYDFWSWIGGHADGIEDLYSVALRELQEETGILQSPHRKEPKHEIPRTFNLTTIRLLYLFSKPHCTGHVSLSALLWTLYL